jgi:hypothetical protein
LVGILFFFEENDFFSEELRNPVPSQKNANVIYINTANVRTVCEGWKYCSTNPFSAKNKPTPSKTIAMKYIMMPGLLFCFTFPMPAMRLYKIVLNIGFFFKILTPIILNLMLS